MKGKKVLFLIESPRGHDEVLVPESKVVEEATKLLKEDKWLTTTKEDGSSEILTKADVEDENDDLEDEEDLKLAADWKGSLKADKPNSKPVKPTKPSPALVKKFEKVTSITCTEKAKGG